MSISNITRPNGNTIYAGKFVGPIEGNIVDLKELVIIDNDNRPRIELKGETADFSIFNEDGDTTLSINNDGIIVSNGAENLNSMSFDPDDNGNPVFRMFKENNLVLTIGSANNEIILYNDDEEETIILNGVNSSLSISDGDNSRRILLNGDNGNLEIINTSTETDQILVRIAGNNGDISTVGKLVTGDDLNICNNVPPGSFPTIQMGPDGGKRVNITCPAANKLAVDGKIVQTQAAALETITNNSIAKFDDAGDLTQSNITVASDNINLPSGASYQINGTTLLANSGAEFNLDNIDNIRSTVNKDLNIDALGTGLISLNTLANGGVKFKGSNDFNWAMRVTNNTDQKAVVVGVYGDQPAIGGHLSNMSAWIPLYVQNSDILITPLAYTIFGNLSETFASATNAKIISQGGIYSTSFITAEDSFISKKTGNQIQFQQTNNTTINITNPAADRTYTIPDVGANANFILSEGAQTKAGLLTLSDGLLTSQTVTAGGFATSGNLVLQTTELGAGHKLTDNEVAALDGIYDHSFQRQDGIIAHNNNIPLFTWNADETGVEINATTTLGYFLLDRNYDTTIAGYSIGWIADAVSRSITIRIVDVVEGTTLYSAAVSSVIDDFNVQRINVKGSTIEFPRYCKVEVLPTLNTGQTIYALAIYAD